jgi:hypothetical protein
VFITINLDGTKMIFRLIKLSIIRDSDYLKAVTEDNIIKLHSRDLHKLAIKVFSMCDAANSAFETCARSTFSESLYPQFVSSSKALSAWCTALITIMRHMKERKMEINDLWIRKALPWKQKADDMYNALK